MPRLRSAKGRERVIYQTGQLAPSKAQVPLPPNCAQVRRGEIRFLQLHFGWTRVRRGKTGSMFLATSDSDRPFEGFWFVVIETKENTEKILKNTSFTDFPVSCSNFGGGLTLAWLDALALTVAPPLLAWRIKYLSPPAAGTEIPIERASSNRPYSIFESGPLRENRHNLCSFPLKHKHTPTQRNTQP